MLYLATPSTEAVRSAMRDGRLGQMVTPNSGNRLEPGVQWALDNGCFSDAWSADRWLRTLDRHAGKPGCLFAVVPDVVADAAATDDLWAKWSEEVTGRGYRAAYVAQNGCRAVPPDAPVAFLGGDTAWKLGGEAAAVAADALGAGCHLHMGRVNSLRRLRYAFAIGCHSVDGTFLAFGPDRNLPRLLRFMASAVHPVLALGWRP